MAFIKLAALFMPQLTHWRTTGIPLKVSMNVMELGAPFRHGWGDHALTTGR